MKAAGYIRVSTDEQVKHGWNLDADRQRIHEIADAKGWSAPVIFDDDGRQGDDPDRPGLLALIDRLGEFDAVIFRSQDRLSRDVAIWAMCSAAFQTAGVKVETFNGPLDLATPEGELFGNMRASFDRFEKRQIGVRVKQAMNARARAGKHHGGQRPYGYMFVDDLLVEHPVEGPIVRRIFEWADWGMSQRAIVKRLHDEGVAKTQSGVGRILANPLYKGLIRSKGKLYPGQHEALVPEAQWDRVNASRGGVRATGGRSPKGSHLLTKGLRRCGRCGSAMIPRLHSSYICQGRRMYGRKFCDQSAIGRKAVDEALLAELIERYFDLEAAKQRLADRQSEDLEQARALTGQNAGELARAEDRLTRIKRAMQDGHLDPADYADQRQELLSERHAAQQAMSRANAHVKALEAQGPLQDADEVLLRQLADLKTAVADGVANAPDLEALRTILRQLFARVELLTWGRDWGRRGDGIAADHAPEVGGYVLLPYLQTEAQAFALQARVLPPVSSDPHDFLCRYCWW